MEYIIDYIKVTTILLLSIKSSVLQLRLEILLNFYLVLFLSYSLLFSNLIFLKSQIQRISHLEIMKD